MFCTVLKFGKNCSRKNGSRFVDNTTLDNVIYRRTDLRDGRRNGKIPNRSYLVSLTTKALNSV